MDPPSPRRIRRNRLARPKRRRIFRPPPMLMIPNLSQPDAEDDDAFTGHDQPLIGAAEDTFESAAAFVRAGAVPENTSELRAIARQTIAENDARQQQALALFDQVSRRFTTALEEAGVDAARVTFKVMELAQASLKNNLELAKAYAGVRSVPDIVGLHAAYLTKQFELLNAQAEELRDITAKLTSRNASSWASRTDMAASTPDSR